MNAKRIETVLAFLYIMATICSIISVVSLVIAWQHWALTLDSCVYFNCNCILYGNEVFNKFLGGYGTICEFCSYGLIPAIIIGLCLGAYHGYRCCIHKKLENPRIIHEQTYINDSRSNAGDPQIVMVRERRKNAFKEWIPASLLASIIFFLSLTHTILITDGYYKTCDEYRRTLIRTLGSRGPEIKVIHDRLVCGAIFDFMDLLHPDIYNWRHKEINTGIALQLAVIMSWLNCIIWGSAASINLIMARNKFRNFRKKFCCSCCTGSK